MKLLVVVSLSLMSLAAQTAASYHCPDRIAPDPPQGRQWVCRQTPFGVMRALEKPDAVAAPPMDIRATDHGDRVSFERPGPFGVYRWERRKSDLDAAERAAWQARSQDRK